MICSFETAPYVSLDPGSLLSKREASRASWTSMLKLNCTPPLPLVGVRQGQLLLISCCLLMLMLLLIWGRGSSSAQLVHHLLELGHLQHRAAVQHHSGVPRGGGQAEQRR